MFILKDDLLKVVKNESEIIFNRLTYEFNSGHIKNVFELNHFFQSIANTFTGCTINTTHCINEMNTGQIDNDEYLKLFKQFLLTTFVANELKFVRGY